VSGANKFQLPVSLPLELVRVDVGDDESPNKAKELDY
jgi:hypothetical protein